MFPKALHDCSLAAFAFAGAKFFGMVTISGVPLSLAAGAVFTLIAAKTKGFLFGGVCGFVCGIACNVPAIAALGILGITYGLIEPNSVILASVLSFMLALSGYLYLSEFSFTLPSAIFLLSAIIAFIPIKKLLPRTETAPIPSVLASRDIKLKKFAAAFSSLSGVFYTISDTSAAESITITGRKVRKTVAMCCDRCKGCSIDINDFCNNLTTELRSNGAVKHENLPLYIKQGCPHSERIIDSVNRLSIMRDEECEKGLKDMAEEYHYCKTKLPAIGCVLREDGRKLSRCSV
ncbi:MAG: hypothetical protein CVU97_01960 [Firmicutes bacterium HGW-Firmicutes-21]|nr:MAG: hypothetical protein CVU97_01960 [Firmicutes bacterium HGW-Firmicutes-21]